MKNSEILLDIFGELDEALIPQLPEKAEHRTAIRRSVIGGGICAAAIIAAVLLLPETGGHKLPTLPVEPESTAQESRETETVIPTETPTEAENTEPTQAETVNGKVKLSSAIIFSGGSFEGLMAYDISELDTPNPWSADMHMEEMPVYRNLSYWEEYPQISSMAGLSEERMQEIAQYTAEGLHTSVVSTNFKYIGDIVGGALSDEAASSAYLLEAECENGYSLSVYGNGDVQINCIRNPLQLITGKEFTISGTDKTQALRALDKLADAFSDLHGYKNPTGYSYADRTFEGDENRSYYLYDKAEDDLQDILNFNFSYTSFSPTDIIRITNSLHTAEYLGDYPIITADEAQALLLGGSYHTTVPQEYLHGGKIAEENIAKAELVYRNQKREKFHQPYYRFYVELDDENFQGDAEGLKTFGVFYVPAVRAEYLTDFHTELRFN